jgi:putative resolvase
MKLSEWARQNGITYKTAWLWWKHGKLPVPARQMPTGTIIVDVPNRADSGAVLYARVSTVERRADLDRQVARLAAFAATSGLHVARVITEVGSGLSGERNELLSALRSPEVGVIVLERRDRLVRFGSEYVEAALAATGRRLLVMEPDELSEDLLEDMSEALTAMCTRLYGRRSARQRAKSAMQAATEGASPTE